MSSQVLERVARERARWCKNRQRQLTRIGSCGVSWCALAWIDVVCVEVSIAGTTCASWVMLPRTRTQVARVDLKSVFKLSRVELQARLEFDSELFQVDSESTQVDSNRAKLVEVSLHCSEYTGMNTNHSNGSTSSGISSKSLSSQSAQPSFSIWNEDSPQTSNGHRRPPGVQRKVQDYDRPWFRMPDSKEKKHQKESRLQTHLHGKIERWRVTETNDIAVDCELKRAQQIGVNTSAEFEQVEQLRMEAGAGNRSRQRSRRGNQFQTRKSEALEQLDLKAGCIEAALNPQLVMAGSWCCAAGIQLHFFDAEAAIWRNYLFQPMRVSYRTPISSIISVIALAWLLLSTSII
ncbi:hypothetical protein GGX14DRAFT_401687 [Mycena pura]|uniref:Uncharacterized protein n=1 Tax=Mycena pura TaxID=153505 RepID=A0AAD6V3X4_9AGAR|nr:hypothetical protein GGX14DRAFT_401687 [Mycena pura]